MTLPDRILTKMKPEDRAKLGKAGVTAEEAKGIRVLFLDFDGVILTLRTLLACEYYGHSQAAPDPMLCALLRRVCASGVQIVVSSSWRDAEKMCREKLTEAGLEEFLHSDWRTGETGHRPREIQAWLSAHPEVADYLILDDDDFGWEGEQSNRWIECSAYDGMSAIGMKLLEEWSGIERKRRQ